MLEYLFESVPSIVNKTVAKPASLLLPQKVSAWNKNKQNNSITLLLMEYSQSSQLRNQYIIK